MLDLFIRFLNVSSNINFDSKIGSTIFKPIFLHKNFHFLHQFFYIKILISYTNFFTGNLYKVSKFGVQKEKYCCDKIAVKKAKILM